MIFSVLVSIFKVYILLMVSLILIIKVKNHRHKIKLRREYYQRKLRRGYTVYNCDKLLEQLKKIKGYTVYNYDKLPEQLKKIKEQKTMEEGYNIKGNNLLQFDEEIKKGEEYERYQKELYKQGLGKEYGRDLQKRIEKYRKMIYK